MKAKLTATTLAALTPLERAYDVRDTEIRGFLLRVLPSGSMSYFFQYRNGKGRQQNFRIGPAGNLKPKQARDIAESLSAKVLSGVDIHAGRKEERARGEIERFHTWGAFLTHQFEPWVLQHRKQGKATVKRLEANFAEFNPKPLSAINAWVIEKWRTQRVKAGISKSTLNRDVGDLKAALAKAVEWGFVQSSPIASLRPFKVDQRATVRYLSSDEEKRLRGALKARDDDFKQRRRSANQWRLERGYELLEELSDRTYADHLMPLVLLAMNTGLRRGELFHLQWSDVNLTAKQLTVRGEKAKSGQTRHVPLNVEAMAVMSAWKAQGSGKGTVFPSDKGLPLTDIKKAWVTITEDAKLSAFRFHDLRHDFASKLVVAGVPLNTVRDLLGHSDLQTTLRYAHLAPDHKAEAVEMIRVALHRDGDSENSDGTPAWSPGCASTTF